MSSDDTLTDWFDTDVETAIDDLEAARRHRLWMLAGFAVVCATGVVAVAAGFVSVVADDQPVGLFWVAAGLAAGPALLLVVLVWATGVQSHMQRRLAGDVVVPGLRRLFGEFRYDSDNLLDEWRSSGLFGDTRQEATGSHRIELPTGETNLRICCLKVGPRFSLRRLLSGGLLSADNTDRRFEGVFAVVEPTDLPDGLTVATPDDGDLPGWLDIDRDWSSLDQTNRLHIRTDTPDSARALPIDELSRLATPDQPDQPPAAVAVSVTDDTLALAIELRCPTIRTDPRRPVAALADLKRYFRTLDLLADL